MKIFLTGQEVHSIVHEYLENTWGVQVNKTDTKMHTDVVSGALRADGTVEVTLTLDGIEAEVEIVPKEAL